MQINTKTKSVRLTKREHDTLKQAAEIMLHLEKYEDKDSLAKLHEDCAVHLDSIAEHYAPAVRENKEAVKA